MKITVFTSNNFRHNYLINKLSNVSDNLNIIQEVNTLFPGSVNDYHKKNDLIGKYFNKVNRAQNIVFRNKPIQLNSKKINLLSIKYKDLNNCSLKLLKNFLNSDMYIIFGASFIKNQLLKFLIKEKAINIHMGISPYFKGTDSNFWALYYKKYQYVGATIHLLSPGIDDGKIIYHALVNHCSDPFLYTMLSVKSAIDSLTKKIKNNSLKDLMPIDQDSKKTLNYSTKKDFNISVLKKLKLKKIPKFEHNKKNFIRPFFLNHEFE